MLHEKIEQLQSNESMQRDSVGFNAQLHYYDIRILVSILIKVGSMGRHMVQTDEAKEILSEQFQRLLIG